MKPNGLAGRCSPRTWQHQKCGLKSTVKCRQIDLLDYMARVRADIDIGALLPSHLCRVLPDATRVHFNEDITECPTG